MSIEKLGIRVANPEKTIVLEGTSFAELVLFEHLRAGNLLRCILALNVAAPHGEDELLAEIQTQLQGMANASAGVLQDLLRVANEQGLRFEIAPKSGDLH